MRRRLWPLLLILLLAGLTGCEFKDIDKTSFVVAIGFDQSDNPDTPYKVTLKLAIPLAKTEAGKTNDYQLISQESSSITEAIRLLRSKVDKELHFGQAQTFLFGEALARKNMHEPLDWLVRRTDIQLIGFMAVAVPTAESVMNSRPISERIAGNAFVMSLGREGTESSYIISENLSDFFRRVKEKGKDPYMPVIRKTKQLYNINRVALFDKNAIRTILDPAETLMLNQLIGNGDGINSYLSTEKEGASININLKKSDFNYSIVTPPNGAPYLKGQIVMSGIAEESNQGLVSGDVGKYEQALEQQAQKKTEELLKKLQKEGVDPIGFGLRYRATRHQPEKEWDQWQEIYPKLEFRIDARVKLESTGLIK